MRLSIEISPEQHQLIKAMAALQGKTIRELVLDKLFMRDGEDENTWQEFKMLLDKRVEAAGAGSISEKNPEQIARHVIQRNKTD